MHVAFSGPVTNIKDHKVYLNIKNYKSNKSVKETPQKQIQLCTYYTIINMKGLKACPNAFQISVKGDPDINILLYVHY